MSQHLKFNLANYISLDRIKSVVILLCFAGIVLVIGCTSQPFDVEADVTTTIENAKFPAPKITAANFTKATQMLSLSFTHPLVASIDSFIVSYRGVSDNGEATVLEENIVSTTSNVSVTLGPLVISEGYGSYNVFVQAIDLDLDRGMLSLPSEFAYQGLYQPGIVFGSAGVSDGSFNTPSDVVADSEGNIYVSDTQNHRIQKFTAAGVFDASFGTKGTGSGNFDSPQGITMDSNGLIYVADSNNDRVVSFNPLDFAGTFSALPGVTLSGPSDVAVNIEEGFIIIADKLANQLEIFDGTSWTTLTAFGIGSADFVPSAVVIADHSTFGNVLFVLDRLGNRVGVFDYKTSEWKSVLTLSSNIVLPESFAVDDVNNQLIVTNTGFSTLNSNKSIVVYSIANADLSTASQVSTWGTVGVDSGEFDKPFGISAKGELLYIVDSKNNRVQTFNL